jgi:signal transduction histidine kinase
MITTVRNYLAAHRRAADAFPGVLLIAVSVVASMAGTSGWHRPHAGPVLWTAAACVPLVWRSRAPIAVTCLVAAAEIAQLAVAAEQPLVPGASLIALYTLATRLPRPQAWTIGMTVSLALTSAVAAARSDQIIAAGTLGSFDLLVLSLAVGDLTRSRRAHLVELRLRAEQAERTRDEEAARRVTAERVRIARDLHDVVAHHITLVNAQAGVAQHLVRTDAEAAYQALGQLKENSRAALDELRATVGLLRQEGDSAESRAPAPTLADLDDLAESFRRAGLTVDVTVTGHPRRPAPSVELAVYRIAQEALTNTAKHAGPGARAHVHLHYGPTTLHLAITDTGRGAGAPQTSTSGHGLIGMRERATAFGGTLTAGADPGGGFRVTAQLPLPTPGES